MTLKKIVILGMILIVGTVGIIGGVSMAQDNSVDNSHIKVSSSGSVDSSPDLAVLSIGIRSTAENPELARNMVAENASNVRQALSNLAIVENIRTQQFSVREERRTSPRPEQVPNDEEINYIAIHTFEVEVNNINEVGRVIDSAINNGATNVENIQFTLSEDKQDRIRNQALEEAMNRARTQAQTIAESSGLTISGVRSVDATSNLGFAGRGFQAETLSADTTIEPGPVDVDAQVTVTYQIN